jgi:TatD DNase family protein
MSSVLSFDAHAHLDASRSVDAFSGSGAVLAMSLSLNESERTLERDDSFIAWGVGCHPRFLRAQEEFNANRFRGLLEKTAIVGEIGLDGGSRVPMETQLHTFRQILKCIIDKPRLVSIHSYQATGLVLQELQHYPVAIPVLHWWTGSVAETKTAVALGCYFSIHSAVARNSKFRLHVPPERILVESDHGENDPPAAIPSRIQWVEFLVAQQYNTDVKELRLLVWKNFTRIIHETKTCLLLPRPLIRFAEVL